MALVAGKLSLSYDRNIFYFRQVAMGVLIAVLSGGSVTPGNSASVITLLDGLILSAQIFWGPDPETVTRFSEHDFYEELNRLAFELDASGQVAINRIKRYARSFPDPTALNEQLETDYIRLFVSALGGVKAPLYQSHYSSPDGQLMKEPAIVMRDRLIQAGLSLVDRPGEPADHLAIEIEYLFYLWESALNGSTWTLEEEARRFIEIDLLPWLEIFSLRLDDDSGAEFYSAAAHMLLSILNRLRSVTVA
jgi:putative dimethyl sulfoxide reductase chaperone